MATGAPDPTSLPFPDSVLRDLLDISLTGVNVLRPVYDPAGEITDFAIEYLNPAGQRMTGLAERPGGTLLTRFPATIATGILAYYRRAYADENAGSYEVNYQADELDNYLRLAARRSGDLLVVSFTDTSDQDRSAVELALRESQAAEQAARAETETQRQRLYHILENFPAVVASYRGPEHVFDLVSHRFQRDFPTRTIKGLPVRQALPELEGQQYYEILDGVYHTGEPFYGTELETWVDLTNTGQLELQYYNVCFQATRDAQGHIDGILNFAYDVTDAVLARQQVQVLNEELAATNEELQASNDEFLASNTALGQAQLQLQQLNQELEARVQARTRELEEQQRLLSQILAQVPAAITTLNGPDHRFTFANARYQQLVEGRVQPGQTMAETLPEVAEQGFIELLDHVYRTGQSFEGKEVAIMLETPGQPPAQHYLDFTYQPMPDAHGQPQGILAFVVDVTAQVRARQQAQALQAELLATAQRQAHEREAFHHVFEQTPALVALLREPGHRFEYVNPAYQAFFPMPLVGLEVAEAAPELVAQGFGALLDRVFQTGESYLGAEMPFTPVAAPGAVPQERYFNFTYQAYRENEQVAGGSIFAFEVTEQVLARQEREVQRERITRLFMQAPAAICILSGPELVYELVNPSYQAIFPDHELLGKPILAVLPEIADNPVYTTFRQVYDTGHTHEEQALLVPIVRPADGVREDRYFKYIQQPRYAVDGRIDGVLVFAFEVTEQVRISQQVQALNEELAAINEKLTATNEELNTTNTQLTRTNVDLDNFIYTASHDLKAPISNIEGLLYLLQEALPPTVTQDAEVGPTLTRMLEAVERFKRTIDHLTDVSKLQKENTPATTLVNLAAVVEDVRLDLAPLLQATGAKLVVDVPALPAIQFSEKNLRSIVYNLLSNAVKYHSPDRPPRVDVRAHVRAGHTVLEVHDNGLGIAQTQLPKLFGMFQRFHDHVEGSGIGLYMVKRMVENAGGRIEVHSQLGAGTTFFVFLPHTTTVGASPFPAYLPS